MARLEKKLSYHVVFSAGLPDWMMWKQLLEDYDFSKQSCKPNISELRILDSCLGALYTAKPAACTESKCTRIPTVEFRGVILAPLENSSKFQLNPSRLNCPRAKATNNWRNQQLGGRPISKITKTDVWRGISLRLNDSTAFSYIWAVGRYRRMPMLRCMKYDFSHSMYFWFQFHDRLGSCGPGWLGESTYGPDRRTSNAWLYVLQLVRPSFRRWIV
jgi:hypothetical protein